MINICQQCGCEFERDRRRKFCSLEHAYEFRTGKPQDPEFVARRAAAMKGVKKSPEHVDKMRAITKSKWDNGEYSRERSFTEEHKRNLKIAAQKRRKKKPYIVKIKNVWPPKIWLDAMNQIFLTCVCGNTFLQKDPRKRYCSRDCKGKEMMTCLNCGNEFLGRVRSGQKFCSYECDKKYTPLGRRCKPNSLPSPAVNVICKNCGDEFITKDKRRKYCSLDCSRLGLKESRTKRIISAKNLIKNSERMKGKNNPAFTHPETFKYKGCQYYDDLSLRLRSGWEANVARIIRAMGYEFEYENKTFLLSDGTTYTPDFYIPEIDELIEVKGRWINDAKEKVKRFIEEYPDLNFNLIGPVEYKGLIREFSQVVN